MLEQIIALGDEEAMEAFKFKRGSTVMIGEMRGTITNIELSRHATMRIERLYVYIKSENGNVYRLWWDDPAFTINREIIKP